MNFNNEQKQAEFDAFAAYFAEVSKQSFTAARRSLVNNLRSIAVGQFGNAAWQELVRANRVEPQPKSEVTLGKDRGGALRRNQSPGQPTAPKPGSPRDLRLKERAERAGRLVAPVVAVGGETAESLLKVSEKAAKQIAKAGAKAKDLLPFDSELSAKDTQEEREFAEMGMDDFAKGLQREDLFADASELSAKELVEKYGRDLIYDYLFNTGESKENLDQKTDRQLANILKKKVSEA